MVRQIDAVITVIDEIIPNVKAAPVSVARPRARNRRVPRQPSSIRVIARVLFVAYRLFLDHVRRLSINQRNRVRRPVTREPK